MTQRNWGLGLPPDIPCRGPIKTLPPVCYADIGLAFAAGAICMLLGGIGVLWIFGG